MKHPAVQMADRKQGWILEEIDGPGILATRADITEKLFSASYVERWGKELVPTSKDVQAVGLVPEKLHSAILTAQWERHLREIVQGREQEGIFVDEMRQFTARLVAQVGVSDAAYRHDNQTHTPCPDYGKYPLRVKAKRGEMLMCPGREYGYRHSVKQTTDARYPNCYKRMEPRDEGKKQLFACVCDYRKELSDSKRRRAQKPAGKGDVRCYLAQREQWEGKDLSALAKQLVKWMMRQKRS